MWDIFKPAKQQVESCERPDCKMRKSEIITEILPTFPEALILNFNWADPDSLSTKDLFKIYMSFNDPLQLHDFYHVDVKRYPEEKAI